MSTPFYDLASLVLVPSGYKTSKVYAQKPLTTDGQLAFTRSTTATRVGSDGLIEKVRTNLVLYSEQFDNAAWSKTDTTITANAETAPDGTLTAETMTVSTSDSRADQAMSLGAGTYTFSAYVKLISQTTAGAMRLQGFVDGVNVSVNFTPTTEWQRFTATYTAASSITSIRIRGQSFVGTIAVWGAQLETGVATDYIATTTAAVSVGPVANVPRLDYLNSSCPRLLLEPQRQNLFINSETFDSANWTKTGATITANVAVSPDGYTNADLQTGGEIYQQKTQPNATACTMSVFVKKDTAASATIRYIDNVSGFVGGGITYTYATNAITILQSANASVSGEAISYGNGWYRLILKYTSTASVTFNYQGIQAGGSFIYGAQFETSASYATSYIPTLGAAVTRGADACSKTGISSLIGQTQGTIFLDVDYSTLSGLNMFLSIRPNASNKVEIYRDSGNIFGEITASVSFAFSAAKPVGTHKIAFAYKSGSSALFIDGVLVNQNTTAFTFSATLADLFINQRSGGTFIEAANYKQALLFPTRLSNAALAELTA